MRAEIHEKYLSFWLLKKSEKLATLSLHSNGSNLQELGGRSQAGVPLWPRLATFIYALASPVQPPRRALSVTQIVFRLCRWGSLSGRTPQQEEQTARDWRDDEPIWKEAELSRLVFSGS